MGSVLSPRSFKRSRLTTAVTSIQRKASQTMRSVTAPNPRLVKPQARAQRLHREFQQPPSRRVALTAALVRRPCHSRSVHSQLARRSQPHWPHSVWATFRRPRSRSGAATLDGGPLGHRIAKLGCRSKAMKLRQRNGSSAAHTHVRHAHPFCTSGLRDSSNDANGGRQGRVVTACSKCAIRQASFD